MDADSYPMPLFVRLAVADIEASTGWYEALGFRKVYAMPVMAHVRYRRYADVMLVDATNLPGEDGSSPRGRGVTLYVNVARESIDDVVARAAGAGIEPAKSPAETAWNAREVAFEDPDGYAVVFSEPVDVDRSFESVMGVEPER